MINDQKYIKYMKKIYEKYKNIPAEPRPRTARFFFSLFSHFSALPPPNNSPPIVAAAFNDSKERVSFLGVSWVMDVLYLKVGRIIFLLFILSKKTSGREGSEHGGIELNFNSRYKRDTSLKSALSIAFMLQLLSLVTI